MTDKPNIVKLIEEKPNIEMQLVLRGHLYLEFLLNEILTKKVTKDFKIDGIRLSFFQKVQLLNSMGLIDMLTKQVLLTINSIRNSYSHKLTFVLSFDNVFTLVNIAANAGIEFSDETIFQDIKKSEEWYGTYGVLMEVLSNTFHHIVYTNDELFDQNEISTFLC